MKDGHPVEETIGERPPVVAAPPCVMVVFGSGGDLTRRKLVPALVNLRRGGLLTDGTRIVAMTRLSGRVTMVQSSTDNAEITSLDLLVCREAIGAL